jgi:hypothetical protein
MELVFTSCAALSRTPKRLVMSARLSLVILVPHVFTHGLPPVPDYFPSTTFVSAHTKRAASSASEDLKQAAYCCTGVQLASGSNSLIAVAASVVDFPKSFWKSTPSWFIMNVIIPELPYSAG